MPGTAAAATPALSWIPRRRYDRRVRLVSGAGAAAALLAAGCVTAGRPFQCPASGGPPWRDLASEHFVVRTDLTRADAVALAGRLEQLRAAVASTLFEGAPEAPGRVEVVAFRDGAEYREFAPAGVDAYYLRYVGGPPRIVLSGELGGTQRALLAHELAHHFLAGVFPRGPRWLVEGIAVYVETLRDADDGKTVLAGTPSPARLERVRREPVDVRDLFRWRSGTPPRSSLREYATSWLLVHFLAQRRPAEFRDYQMRLVRNEEPEAAWRAAFPEWDPATPALEGLDRLLAIYARSEVASRRVEVPLTSPAGMLEQPIPPPEVHAIRLGLWPQRAAHDPAELRAEVDETLREDPAHPLALQARAALEGTDPLPPARASVAAHPDDPRAWTFLALSLRDASAAAEREGAYRQAAALAPDNAAALHNLAGELLDQGRSGEALPLARQAALLAPWSPPLLETYAAVLSDLGRCAEAAAIQQRALDALPDGAGAETRAASGTRLAAYAVQCGTAAPARGVERATPLPARPVAP